MKITAYAVGADVPFYMQKLLYIGKEFAMFPLNNTK